jgi:aryl-alcohol dehydrogenase-like predicted oxidoreductase
MDSPFKLYPNICGYYLVFIEKEVLQMKKVRLGNTGLVVTKLAMGCLPIQRCSIRDAVRILQAAYEGGINFFDTANSYTDSEEKLGLALSHVRDKIIIATKSMGRDKKTVAAHIENSLRMLKTDYIDLFQFHMPSEIPDPNDKDGPFAAAYEARDKGYIRHIGITAHRLQLAFEHIERGLFETLQYPFSYLSDEREHELVKRCGEAGMGFIAMKGMAGGLLRNARACYAYMARQEGVVPIWGIQSMDELNQWLALAREEPELDEELMAVIEEDRRQLSGSFCRGCGYCMPCPVGIEINNSARMNMLLRRSPWRQYFTPEWREKMSRIKDCMQCGQCRSKCPYGLNIPELLKYMLEDYNSFYEQHREEM